LLIAALAVSLAASLCMVIIFWTRRTYPGFGYWVAGHFCGTVCILLFILPRDQFPPWLTIILANYLWFASMMLNYRGSLLFRSRRISYGWEIAASVSFCALFAYFTYVEPNIAARLTVIAVYHSGFQLSIIAVLLIKRPAYFGSSDVLQVVSLGILVAINTIRAEQIWISGGSFPHQVIALQPFIDMLILGVMASTLLVILSHIMMNAQRLEYDYRIAQERLELALDGGNIGSYAAHLLTGETFVDERHQRLLGYHPGEIALTVQNWLEYVHPEDQSPLLQRYAEVVKGQQFNFESEYRVRRRDGTWLWVLDRGQSFDRDETGRPKRVAGTLMDITERKQAEAALRQSNARYDDLVRRIPVGVYILRIPADKALQFEYVSEKFCQMLGVDEPDVLRDAEYVHGRIHPDDRASLDEANQLAVQTLTPFRWEGRSRAPGEKMRWLRIESEPFVLPNGDSLWNGVIIDITERKQAEAALNQANDALEEAQRLAKVGSWDWDIATDTVTWSKELYRIFGRDPNVPAPTYQEHPQIYTAESTARLVAAAKPAIDHGLPYQVDLEFVRPDGVTGWLIGRGEPRYDAHHHVIGLRGTCTDITDQRRIEEDLRRSLVEIQRHNARMATLIEMNDLLLSCETRQEAYAVIGHSAEKLFIACSGCLAISRDSQPEWDVVASWGQAPPQSSTFLLQACWALRLGELHQVADPQRDLGCSHFAGSPESAYLCVPLMVRSQMLGLLHVSADSRLTDESFADLRTLVVAVSESIKLALSNLQLREALREQAIRDPLTGLFNRRYLDETLHRELHRCQRDHQPLAVAMLDIDHFKHFNDVYGHEAGDAVLQVVGGLLRQSLRASDIACRYGGEELTLILPGSSLADAEARLENLRQAIQQQRTPYRDTDLPVITVSTGLAAMRREDTDATALLARADAAPYQAKAQGRNRIVVAEEEA